MGNNARKETHGNQNANRIVLEIMQQGGASTRWTFAVACWCLARWNCRGVRPCFKFCRRRFFFPKQIVWTPMDTWQNSFPCEPTRKSERSAVRWENRSKELSKRYFPRCYWRSGAHPVDVLEQTHQDGMLRCNSRFTSCPSRTVGGVFHFDSNGRKARQKYMKCLDRAFAEVLPALAWQALNIVHMTKLLTCGDRTEKCCRLQCSVARAKCGDLGPCFERHQHVWWWFCVAGAVPIPRVHFSWPARYVGKFTCLLACHSVRVRSFHLMHPMLSCNLWSNALCVSVERCVGARARWNLLKSTVSCATTWNVVSPQTRTRGLQMLYLSVHSMHIQLNRMLYWCRCQFISPKCCVRPRRSCGFVWAVMFVHPPGLSPAFVYARKECGLGASTS